ncbi:efflux RND transporter periplasmic adaptor subunit [Photobacterium sanctipauli]|uniref:Efflux RND transporter periplasmic adaptor subunit n=1 Tax=Photobacterium sanctipauli TaxID=1342794 RepID=A0A2T3NN85_9GAMM|nr:efflux RND transporter periplasmic adaptor subunit [Photobacterium sanctipauli]
MATGLVSLIGGLTYYKYSEIKTAIEFAESFPEHYEVVEPTVVEATQHIPVVSVLGTALSPEQTELYSELSGKVTKVAFLSGESVAKGQLIFQVDISEELARVKSAKAREKHARSVYMRAKKLLGTKAISQEKHDQAYADLIVIQSEIDVLNTTIDKKTVTAPFDGVVGMHNLKQGDFVTANQMLASFVGVTDTMWVEFSVPQFYPEMFVGDDVAVRNIDALGLSRYQTAKIIARDTQIASNTRSLRYRAKVSREKVEYTPNTPMEVNIPVSANQTVFKVPLASVNQDLYGDYVVQLIEQDDQPGAYRAQRLPVEVIAEREGYRFLSQGVTGGELIAAAGSFKLYDGLLVRTRAKQPGQYKLEQNEQEQAESSAIALAGE